MAFSRTEGGVGGVGGEGGTEGEILRCPWHGWEFDLATGRSVFDPTRTRVKSYPVEIERDRAAMILA